MEPSPPCDAALPADPPPPPPAALPLLFAGLPARQLCVAAAVCAEWRRAAAGELRRAMRLDGEADAGRALRALAAALPGLPLTLEALSLVRVRLPRMACRACRLTHGTARTTAAFRSLRAA
jgi:hypothetical protein